MLFVAYAGLKHRALVDRYGRQIREERTPLIFWTLWSLCVVVGLGGLGVVIYSLWTK